MLKELIDEFYRKEERGGKRDYFYVSEVNDCRRKIYLKVTGAEKEELGPVQRRKFERGNQTHQSLVSVLYSLGVVTASEIKIPSDKLFRGRADAIISMNGNNYVVEIKLVSPYSFKSMDKPRDSHLNQLLLYLYYFNIEKGMILVECKGTQKLKEFLVEKDEGKIREIISEFKELREKIRRGEVPGPRKARWKFDKCKYCLYEEACKTLETEEKSKLSFY